MLRKGVLLEATALLVFFLWLERLVNNRIVDHYWSLIFNCLTGLRLLDLYHMIYPSLLMGYVILVFFTNISFMEFQVTYLAFLLFAVMDGFGWF